MIPTTFKHRLPKELEYPARAGQLTDALADVPQVDKLSLSYHRHCGSAADFTRAIRSGEPFSILVGRYTRSHLGLSECNELAARGFYGPTWALYVYPVPATFAAIARAELTKKGFAALRAWLSEQRSDLWLENTHEYTIRFSTSQSALILPTDA